MTVLYKGGELVGNIRGKKGLSQSEVAKLVKISQSHLSDIERGTKQPSASILKRLSEVLGFTMNEWFEGKKV